MQLFWERHTFFDPVHCLPPDRMHQVDQGVFKTMVSWAVDLMEMQAFKSGGGKYQNKKTDELNRYVMCFDMKRCLFI